jgi:hypothetical protein
LHRYAFPRSEDDRKEAVSLDDKAATSVPVVAVTAGPALE